MDLHFRKAKEGDVEAIVALLADDDLGKKREHFESPLLTCYLTAFHRIATNPEQNLMVAETGGKIVGTFQLSFLPYLTYQGGLRAQIEAVRVSKDFRGKGLGEKMFRWAIERAKEEGAHLIQLTTDKQRPDAVRFYEKLGFRATHEGMKLHF